MHGTLKKRGTSLMRLREQGLSLGGEASKPRSCGFQGTPSDGTSLQITLYLSHSLPQGMPSSEISYLLNN